MIILYVGLQWHGISKKKIPNNFCKCTLVIPVHALEMYVNPCKSEFGGYFNV